MNLLTMIMVLTPSAPPIYRAMFTIPNNALQSAMACRVFRGLKLNILSAMSEPGTGGQVPSVPLVAWRPTNSGGDRTESTDFHRPDGKTAAHLDPYANNFVDIKVTRDTEMARDEDLEPMRRRPSN